MGHQMTFKRYELKYMLTQQQKAQIVHAMEPYMKLDEYGRTAIRNIYFDTDTFRLIRRSIEKPAYKEKLRVRSYQRSWPDDKVFVELKKKYNSVVYKRRISMPRDQAMDWLCNGSAVPAQSQIADEIEYLRDYYETLRPAVFLSYEREAYYALDGSDFRVTFDDKILYRERELTLGGEVYGTPLLEKGRVLMEVKTSGGLPLWMTQVLSQQQIFKTTFSKYAEAYQDMLCPKSKGGRLYA